MITRLCNLPESQSFFLFGPRGSGKSTLLKSHFQNQKVTWINLLEQSLDLRLSQNPDHLLEIWSKEKLPWVVIDEVQKVPALLDVVHRGIEDYKIKFALTGSSARKLKRGGANLLAGRAVDRQLQPFSAIELGSAFDLPKALQYGLLPKLWDQDFSQKDSADFLFSYVNTYLKEEIASEQLVRNLDPFRRFLVSAAQTNGKIINHSAIERDSGVPRKQSERHFEILVDTLIGHYLPPHHNSIRKRQTQKAKFYFFDTGVVRAIQNLADFEIESSTYEYGDLFETLVINEFFKLSSALQKRWEFSYLQTTDDREIDLIIERPRSKPILVEIKSFKKFSMDNVAPLFALKKDIPHQAAYVLSNDPQSMEIDKVRCLPWIEGLKEIFELPS